MAVGEAGHEISGPMVHSSERLLFHRRLYMACTINARKPLILQLFSPIHHERIVPQAHLANICAQVERTERPFSANLIRILRNKGTSALQTNIASLGKTGPNVELCSDIHPLTTEDRI